MEFTEKQLTEIIAAANEVITALADENEDLSKSNTVGMIRAYDYLNDDAAPPEVVKRLAEIALVALQQEPVGEVVLGDFDDCGDYPDAKVVCIAAQGQAGWNNFRNGTVLYAESRLPQPSVMDERAAFNAWNNEENLPIAGVGAKNAVWLAWQARAAMLQGKAEPVSTPYKLPPHVYRELVNSLRDIAIKYQGCQQLREQISETLSAVITHTPHCGNSPVIPDGWVIVPVEPTESMIVDGFESEPDEDFSDPKVWEAYDAMSGCQQAAHRAKLCWAAMIAAAPQQEVKSE
ncbi:hypothetical protein [Yokenella regensburgei]|uniref:hypothetical protein n=1 Tax=Yokenella regensburgei TaxID=158877 RepID=UPI001432B794|nr:hypothetical protein [Yokenella regensburgei]QIU87856.1 hypothetical protein HEC60_08870 [Yokenella regensburgei]